MSSKDFPLPSIASLRASAALKNPHLGSVRPARIGLGFEPGGGNQVTLAQVEEVLGGPGQLALTYSLRWLLDAMSGLGVLHRTLGFVHGEVQPESIALGDDGVGRLIPVVRAHWVRGEPRRPERLHYLAPERLLGDRVDARSDIFSFGVLLWEAMAGRRLLESSDPDDIIARLMSRAVGRLRVREGETWASPLVAVAERAISVDPAARFGSVAQMKAMIESVTGQRLANAAKMALLFADPRQAARAESEHTPSPDSERITLPQVLPQARPSDRAPETAAELPDFRDSLPTLSREDDFAALLPFGAAPDEATHPRAQAPVYDDATHVLSREQLLGELAKTRGAPQAARASAPSTSSRPPRNGVSDRAPPKPTARASASAQVIASSAPPSAPPTVAAGASPAKMPSATSAAPPVAQATAPASRPPATALAATAPPASPPAASASSSPPRPGILASGSYAPPSAPPPSPPRPGILASSHAPSSAPPRAFAAADVVAPLSSRPAPLPSAANLAPSPSLALEEPSFELMRPRRRLRAVWLALGAAAAVALFAARPWLSELVRRATSSLPDADSSVESATPPVTEPAATSAHIAAPPSDERAVGIASTPAAPTPTVGARHRRLRETVDHGLEPDEKLDSPQPEPSPPPPASEKAPPAVTTPEPSPAPADNPATNDKPKPAATTEPNAYGI